MINLRVSEGEYQMLKRAAEGQGFSDFMRSTLLSAVEARLAENSRTPNQRETLRELHHEIKKVADLLERIEPRLDL
jgi:uncharacterized protein (DUF1778 family)